MMPKNQIIMAYNILHNIRDCTICTTTGKYSADEGMTYNNSVVEYVYNYIITWNNTKPSRLL